jgi:DNA replication and repair protein RecF
MPVTSALRKERPVIQVYLDSLTLSGMRIVDRAELSLGCDLVIFTGPNGSGKTTVLEAVHILSTGRSFRTRSAIDVIQRGRDSAMVNGTLLDVTGRSVRMGVEKRRYASDRLRLDGLTPGRVAELARRLPLVTITPDGQRLLTEGSEGRRRLLDWLLFHVEPAYAQVHARFRHVLRQRNASLRGARFDGGVQEAWDGELSQAGMALQVLRDRHFCAVESGLTRLLGQVSAVPVEVALSPGWRNDLGDLSETLQRNWHRDQARGFTTEGPHRADLSLSVSGRPARDVLSRGEGKLVTVGLQIALARLLAEIVQVRPVILVDELASELDDSNRERFFAALRETGCQTLVTTVDPDLVRPGGWRSSMNVSMHQGNVVQVLQ